VSVGSSRFMNTDAMTRFIEDFEPDFEPRYGLSGLADFVESFEQLGGVMTEELRAHVAALDDEFSSYRLALQTPAKTQEQPGRNDPAPAVRGRSSSGVASSSETRLPTSLFLQHYGTFDLAMRSSSAVIAGFSSRPSATPMVSA